MSNNAHELSTRLLNALDNNYNVVDMHTVNEIISILEKFNITKELLETTRLGKHVNELRRKTSDPTLARRAKVLVKRWRDLVIPTVASPGHPGANRTIDHTVRRLGGTPLTSPALSRVASPAVQSPRPPSRPAWGGYESDSQDVILVDDEPSPLPPPSAPAHTHKPITPPVKRPPSPEPLYDDKKAKRDKKPKKRRGHSRAGSGTETAAGGGAPAPWRDRNGTDRRRNGCRNDSLDPYTALVHKMPPAGAKKVKTTKELLEEIQSRGSKPSASRPHSPASPGSPASPDVMLIEPEPVLVKVDSPVRNGGATPARRSPTPPPLEEERAAEECTCGEEADPACRARPRRGVTPAHVAALHAALLPGVNGTRAPALPHQYAVRRAEHPDIPGLFASVVPLYKYSDYADDRLVKNMSRVPLCAHLPYEQFAPDPPPPPPPPTPPYLRGRRLDAGEQSPEPRGEEAGDAGESGSDRVDPAERVTAEPMETDDREEPSDRIKAEAEVGGQEERAADAVDVKPPAHRTVERTKEEPPEPEGGAALMAAWRRAADAVPYEYSQLDSAPVLALPASGAELAAALQRAAAETRRDALGRPLAPERFAEWHESARLPAGLVALPYVVID